MPVPTKGAPAVVSHQPYLHEGVLAGAQPTIRTPQTFSSIGSPRSSQYGTPQAPSPFAPVHQPSSGPSTPQHVLTSPKSTPVNVHHGLGTPISPTKEMGTIPHLQQHKDFVKRPPKLSKFALQTLMQTDGIIPAQYGTNRYASRKGMTEYGAFRDVHGKHYHRLLHEDPTMATRENELLECDAIIPGQYGTNRFASRKGMTEYGAFRDVHGTHFHRLLEEDPEIHFSETAMRQSDAVIGGQYGSNRFASRKGMTEYGAARDVHGKHYHRLLEEDGSMRQADGVLRESDGIIGGQYGTNRFCSRKGMTEYGAGRDVHGKHYHRLLEEDPTMHQSEGVLRESDAIIGGQYGSNRFASRKGMTEYGAPRDVHGKHYHRLIEEDADLQQHFPDSTLRMTDAIIGGQYGTNRFASRKGMTEYGAPRDVKGKHVHRVLEEDPGFMGWSEPTLRMADAVIGAQYGTNKFDSQAGMTKFGTPRDVVASHLHRITDDYNFTDNIVI